MREIGVFAVVSWMVLYHQVDRATANRGQRSAEQPNVSGTWQGRHHDLKGGEYPVRTELTQVGSTISGKLFNPVEHTIERGTISGDTVRWVIVYPPSNVVASLNSIMS